MSYRDYYDDDSYNDLDYYDKLDFKDGTPAFPDDNEDTYEGPKSKHKKDESENETGAIDFSEWNWDKEEVRSNKNEQSDWHLYGLDKQFPDKEFDEDKVNQMFFTFDGESDKFDEKMQMEALRYAAFFARKGNNDAKNFIISIVIQSKYLKSMSHDVKDMAGTAFWLFFRNYLRTEVEKYYNLQPISAAERYSRIEGALQHCNKYVFENIDNFDPTIAKINTYYNSQIIRGVILDFEALRKGRSSKQTMRIDKLVANSKKKFEENGIEPTVAIIAADIGKGYGEVETSLARITAENTMVTYDVDGLNNNGGSIAQSTFSSPEDKILAAERIKDLIKHINETLNDTERDFFLWHQGVFYTGDTLIPIEPKKFYEIGYESGVDTELVKQVVNTAIRKLKKSYGVNDDSDDSFLSSVDTLFDDDDDGNDLDDIIKIDE